MILFVPAALKEIRALLLPGAGLVVKAVPEALVHVELGARDPLREQVGGLGSDYTVFAAAYDEHGAADISEPVQCVVREAGLGLDDEPAKILPPQETADEGVHGTRLQEILFRVAALRGIYHYTSYVALFGQLKPVSDYAVCGRSGAGSRDHEDHAAYEVGTAQRELLGYHAALGDPYYTRGSYAEALDRGGKVVCHIHDRIALAELVYPAEAVYAGVFRKGAVGKAEASRHALDSPEPVAEAGYEDYWPAAATEGDVIHGLSFKGKSEVLSVSEHTGLLSFNHRIALFVVDAQYAWYNFIKTAARALRREALAVRIPERRNKMDLLKNAGRRTLLIISGLCFAAVFAYEIYLLYLAFKAGGMASLRELFAEPVQIGASALMILGWLLLALGCIADKKGMYMFGAFAGLAGSGIRLWQAIENRIPAGDGVDPASQLARAQASAGLIAGGLVAAAFLFLFFSLLVGHRKIALLTLLPVVLFAAADGAGFLIFSHFGQSYFTGLSGGKDWRVDAATAAGLLLASLGTGINKAHIEKAPDAAPVSSLTYDDDDVPKGPEGSVFAEPQGASPLEVADSAASAAGAAADEIPPVPELVLPPDEERPKPEFDENIPVLKIPEGLIDMSIGEGSSSEDSKEA